MFCCSNMGRVNEDNIIFDFGVRRLVAAFVTEQSEPQMNADDTDLNKKLNLVRLARTDKLVPVLISVIRVNLWLVPTVVNKKAPTSRPTPK